MADSAGQNASDVHDLDDFVRRSRNVRQRFEPKWYLQLAYYSGFQWVRWDGARLYEPRLEPWRVKLVDNRILPVVRTEVAKMTKSRPVFVATPRTPDDENVKAALMAENVLDFLWTALDLPRKQRQALLWSRIAGAGFWKLYWDRERGDTVEILADPEGKPVYDGAGRPVKADLFADGPPEGLQAIKVARGDVCVEMRTPFELFPDPLAGEEGLESAEWVVEEVVQSAEYVRSRYNEDLEPDAAAASGIAESRIPGLVHEGGAERQGVKVRELWMKPSSQFPRGRHVVWAQNRVLHEGDNPYPWLPYVMFRGVPVPGRFWPSSVAEQLISPQTELNKRKSQIAENAARIANPALMRSSASDFEWQGLPGEEIVFQDMGTPGSVPTFLQPPELPGYVREDIARIEASMQEISGQHEVTHGNVPSGVTAASAINLLQEQDDTQLGPDILDMETTLALAGSRILALVHTYYDDARTIRIAGEDGAYDIFDFKGAMLKGNTQIEVQTGSGMPRSKAAKQAAMQDLLNLVLQYGVQVKQRDLRKFFKDYEVGGLERMFADLEETERKVNRENRRLSLGEEVTVNDWDDHALEVEGHTSFMRSARYEALDENIKANFELHLNEHRVAMMPPPMEDPMGGDPGLNGANGNPLAGGPSTPPVQSG